MDRIQPSGQITRVLASICLVILIYGIDISGFLLDDKLVKCPNPASNCLQETFNRVLPGVGCLGCQSGCKPGYIMTSNPGHYVNGGDPSASYIYEDISVPNNTDVTEPQWLCLKGDSCRWGFYADKMGANDVCSYCGLGCLKCQSYTHCDQCLPGYHLSKGLAVGVTNTSTSLCIGSGVLCPKQPDHCQYESYAVKTVGCLGCVFCDEGYMPSSNPNYRRKGENVTSGYYDYQGLNIAGSVEINEPRYVCLQGDHCPDGWHNVTRGELTTCELDP